MAYVTKKFFLETPQKTFQFLMENLHVSIHEAQKIIDRKRVLVNGEILEVKSGEIYGEIEVVVFEPNPYGLKPIFETEDFAVFDKPSGLLIHPRKRESIQTLNDDIKALFGKDANAVHRIDKETSGLVLVSKNKDSEVALKTMFENKSVQKEYLALVFGKIEKEFVVDAKLLIDKPESLVRLKVHVDERGKEAKTFFDPIEYYEEIDATLLRAYPQTGRQHQIRVHLFHVEHSIFGDTLYGVTEEFASDFLERKIDKLERNKITKATRLLLHANKISFEYKNKKYEIESTLDVAKIFLNKVRYASKI